MPTVCSETCEGRIRYLGVLLYDADLYQRSGERTCGAGSLTKSKKFSLIRLIRKLSNKQELMVFPIP